MVKNVFSSSFFTPTESRERDGERITRTCTYAGTSFSPSLSLARSLYLSCSGCCYPYPLFFALARGLYTHVGKERERRGDSEIYVYICISRAKFTGDVNLHLNRINKIKHACVGIYNTEYTSERARHAKIF